MNSSPNEADTKDSKHASENQNHQAQRSLKELVLFLLPLTGEALILVREIGTGRRLRLCTDFCVFHESSRSTRF